MIICFRSLRHHVDSSRRLVRIVKAHVSLNLNTFSAAGTILKLSTRYVELLNYPLMNLNWLLVDQTLIIVLQKIN